MPGGFRDVDKGFKAIGEFIRLSDGLKAQAGIQGAEASAPRDDFGNRNIDLAVFAEFGTVTAPERSFVRATFDRQREKYGRLVQRAVDKGLDGSNIGTAFGRLAELMASDMKQTINESIELAPLAESTIRRRIKGPGAGNPRPLLDTGQMKNSITGVVTK